MSTKILVKGLIIEIIYRDELIRIKKKNYINFIGRGNFLRVSNSNIFSL